MTINEGEGGTPNVPGKDGGRRPGAGSGGGGGGSNAINPSDITPPSLTTNTSPPPIEAIPGDLGQRHIGGSTQVLIAQAIRKTSSDNLFRPWNHRYRGHREAWKFNLIIQQLQAVGAKLFLLLKGKNDNLKISEQEIMPTEAEIALVYHCREQVRFHEWRLLKDANRSWFE